MVRGPVSMVIVGIVMLFMFGLVALGPRAFEEFLPESATVFLETMGNPQMLADRGYVPSGKSDKPAGAFLHDRTDGWKVNGPIAAMEGGFPVYIEDVMAGHKARMQGQVPGEVEVIASMTACTPTPPSPDARVAHVAPASVEHRDLGLWTYGDGELAAAVQQFAINYRQRGKFRNTPAPQDAGYEAFDIAVTETARPVYLVVVSNSSWARWIANVALAPGARLERVVLLGGAHMGVANLPEGVPVEVLRFADLEACGTRPFYPLNPGSRYYQEVAKGVVSSEAMAAKEAEMAAFLASWEGAFHRWFGVGSAATLAGDWQGATVSVAGPVPMVPEMRAVWLPVTGARILTTADRYVETPLMEEEGRGFAATVKAIATAFAWGDLENLNWDEGF